jgi:hypothetical protein
VLAPHYGYDPLLETFFTATLGIKDCCAQDVLDELETRSENRDIPTDLAVAGEMYAFLDTESSNVDWQDMEYVNAFFDDIYCSRFRKTLAGHATSIGLVDDCSFSRLGDLITSSPTIWQTRRKEFRFSFCYI